VLTAGTYWRIIVLIVNAKLLPLASSLFWIAAANSRSETSMAICRCLMRRNPSVAIAVAVSVLLSSAASLEWRRFRAVLDADTDWTAPGLRIEPWSRIQ
jgi:hypothetical protein